MPAAGGGSGGAASPPALRDDGGLSLHLLGAGGVRSVGRAWLIGVGSGWSGGRVIRCILAGLGAGYVVIILLLFSFYFLFFFHRHSVDGWSRACSLFLLVSAQGA
jgi:hypothetical protein